METEELHTVEPIQWTPAGVVILDQLKLPAEVVHHTYTDYRDVAKAIQTMIIRGAPAIGVAAAMGIALDLFWAIARLKRRFEALALGAASRNGVANLEEIRAAMVREALLVHEE